VPQPTRHPLPPAVQSPAYVATYSPAATAVGAATIPQQLRGSAPAAQPAPSSRSVAGRGFSAPNWGSKRVTLNCRYKGKDYRADLTLSQAAFREYLEREDLIGWAEPGRGGLLARVSDQRDSGVAQLANAINRQAREQGLNDNERAELAKAFVQQGVKYGDVRPVEGIKYPYVTLYDESGVCGDKSVLLAALLRRLGYASSLFYYYPRANEPQNNPDNPHHMVAGIRMADGRGSYGTAYATIETSGDSKIGAPLSWPKPKELVLTSNGRSYSRDY